jgi:hypothetical protein
MYWSMMCHTGNVGLAITSMSYDVLEALLQGTWYLCLVLVGVPGIVAFFTQYA